MAKQIEGVSERILACAKAEFLEKGYTKASLRTIAAAANTSTNSIYVRFKDKAGLFAAIVEPVLDEMLALFVKIQEDFHHKDSSVQAEEMVAYSANGGEILVDYIYDHEDVFRLLLDASAGTRFARFFDEMVRIETDYTYKYMEATGCPKVGDDATTQMVLHMVLTAHIETMFEVVRHGMNREEAKKYVALLGRYHHTGFEALFPTHT